MVYEQLSYDEKFKRPGLAIADEHAVVVRARLVRLISQVESRLPDLRRTHGHRGIVHRVREGRRLR